MNKQGQMAVVLAVIFLVVVIGVGYYALNSGSTTGRTTGNAVSGCQNIDVAASYLVVGSHICSGGSEAATCTIQLQNSDSVSIAAEPIFECTTSAGSQMVTATEQSLSVDQVGDFSISFDNAGSDWTCSLYNAQTTKTEEVCN